MKTDGKKRETGILSIGAAMFISQFGAIGKNLSDSSSRNKLPEFC